MDALSAVLRALLPLSPLAQTRVIAAAAEYYGLSLTVEN
jgi:hypothetical protein